ncbi:unnamed protein product [Peniophora sp. CBMAI 1063]|nr:unnamed protein product [Peniophora sp. CBMAI 1063]
MSTFEVPPVLPSLGPSLGALEIGVFMAFFLSGITAVQTFIYYQSDFRSDSHWIKVLIVFVLVVEIVHDGLVAGFIYNATINGFGDFASLELAPWALSSSIAVGSLAQAPVQLFFAWRVYVMRRKHIWITAVSATASLLRVACSIAIAVLSQNRSIIVSIERYKWLVITTLASGAFVDVLNTTMLVYVLYRARGEISRSRKMVERLMLWSVETGLLTTMVSILGLILLFALPDTPAFLSVGMVFAKLYSNTLLASLNGRVSLRSTGTQAHVSVLTIAGDHSRGLSVLRDGGSVHRPSLHVELSRQKVIARDSEYDGTDNFPHEISIKSPQLLADHFPEDTEDTANDAAHGRRVEEGV